MGQSLDYSKILSELDSKLEEYWTSQSKFLCCKAGCSECCEKGDYPISDIELEYLMHGYMKLENEVKIKIQENINTMEKGGSCPFLIQNLCSVYQYRPIICRTHGLAYMMNNGIVNVPYCVNNNKNYSKVYKDETLYTEPVLDSLATTDILKDFNPVIKNLYDWLKK